MERHTGYDSYRKATHGLAVVLLAVALFSFLTSDPADSTQQTVSTVSSTATINAKGSISLTTSTTYPQLNLSFTDNSSISSSYPPDEDWVMTDVVIQASRCLDAGECISVYVNNSTTAELARVVLDEHQPTFTMNYTTGVMADDALNLYFHILSGTTISSSVSVYVLVNGFEL